MASCGSQLRAGSGGAFGLDFPAFFKMGEALDADLELLAMVLPRVEAARIESLQEDSDDADA